MAVDRSGPYILEGRRGKWTLLRHMIIVAISCCIFVACFALGAFAALIGMVSLIS